MTIRTKKALNFALRVMCVLLALACVTVILWQANTRRQGQSANERMRALYDPTAGAEELSQTEPAPQTQESFAALLEENPDTVGWLSASQTMDFAVVKRDNSYYLTHNFFGESTAEGAAFLDEGNEIYPRDQHLLIHGHNMRDGSVFGDLDFYRDLTFLQEHALVEFNTIYEDCTYVPFAVFDYSANPGDQNFIQMQTFNFETQDDYMTFVLEAKDRSIYQIDLDVAVGDPLLSLVTCSYSHDNGRMVVMLRALREGETEQDIAEVMAQAVLK